MFCRRARADVTSLGIDHRRDANSNGHHSGSSAPSGSALSPTDAALIHTASMKVGDKTQTVLKNEKRAHAVLLHSDLAAAATPAPPLGY
jgi:hypothetical protein